MIPYVVPLGVFIVLAALLRVPRLSHRYTLSDAAAWSLGALLLLTGCAHFVGLRDDMIRMVPPLFPRPDLLVTLTGVFELLGAIALIPRATRSIAGVALALLFVALLPANIYAAQQGLTFGGEPAPPLALRIPEQLIYIALALAPVFSARRKRAGSAAARPEIVRMDSRMPG
jgi:uncharacterized membrane protein